MRYDLKKFLFVGILKEKEVFFKKAQTLGIVQFIDSQGTGIKTIPSQIQHITDAIKVLRGLPPVVQEEREDFSHADEIAERINGQHRLLNQLKEEERLIELEIGRIEAYGNFSWSDIHFIEKEGHRHVQFFCAKEDAIEPREHEELIYVGSNHELDYFIAFNKEPKTYENMVELEITRPLNEVRLRQTALWKEIHAIDSELKNLAKYNLFLHHSLIAKLNLYHLDAAKSYVQKPLEETDLFTVEGWVPVNKIEALHRLVDKMHAYTEEIAVAPNETIPTYLENNNLGRVGEDLVHIYDTPSHTDKDPSLWVLWFFALFFAVIVGDAGYGMVYLIAAIYFRYKFANAKDVGKRFIKLMFILSSTCIIWGILTNSFFGMSLDINNPVRKLSLVHWLVEKRTEYHIKHHDKEYEGWIKKYPELKDVTDPHEFVGKAVTITNGNASYPLLDTYTRGVMLELALIIGLIHLTLSFLRYIKRNWSGIGWILVMIGGYLFAPTFLQTTSSFYYLSGMDVAKGGQIGLQLVAIGLLTAVGLSVVKHKFLGIFEIMTSIQVFADVLSYLRLFALGLAGAIVGATINELAAGLPAVLAVIMIVISHMLNMVLGIMGGVIHGLRLNFLEWYHYSFQGGGKMFQPLRLMKIE